MQEDHPTRAPRDRSDNPYVTTEGKHRELIEIAEASGWNWEFSGYSYTEDGKPVDHVDFKGKAGGEIVKVVGYVLESPETGPDGRPILWNEGSETTSSIEEAMQSKVQFTQLTFDPGEDSVIKQGIARLLEVITRRYLKS